jgi:hypothetical protein
MVVEITSKNRYNKILMKVFLILSAAILCSLIGGASVSAAPASTKTSLGIDVSYPQCAKKVPTNHAFGIVGVNGGLATTENPCLDTQLTWASKATGDSKQDLVQLYVNTANPGGLGTASWPQDNIDPSGNFIISPYGLCFAQDSTACAWQYGWNRAHEDVNQWFARAVHRTKLDKNPTAYIWWLDVEIENTWKTGKTDADYQSNVAVLEGMAEYFAGRGIRTGLYSTAYQWGEVTGGKISETSRLNGLPNWRPGGYSLSSAKQACQAQSLTRGGTVLMAQYISHGLDYNYSCAQ